MIHDALKNWNLYLKSDPWRYAFEYISSLSQEVEDCPYVPLMDDTVYVSIMTYETCRPEESVLETHDRYIDIQVSLINSEAIEWFPRQILKIKEDYNSKIDRTLYYPSSIAPVRINNLPGFFSVFFPDDAHMPKLITNSKPEFVKKVVVKLDRRLILPRIY